MAVNISMPGGGELYEEILKKQNAPTTAGTSGQVLGLDSNLDPVWVNQSGGTTDIFIVNPAQNDTLDKTWQEIYDALQSKAVVLLETDSDFRAAGRISAAWQESGKYWITTSVNEYGETTQYVANSASGYPAYYRISNDLPVKDVQVNGTSVVNDGVASITVPSVPVQDVQVNGTSVVQNGVANVDLSELEEDVSDLKNAIDVTQDMIGGYSIVFTKGGYIMDNIAVGSAVTMTPTASDNYAYSVVGCVEHDRFRINGTGVNNALLWCFVDAQNKVLTKSGLNVTGTNLDIVAPANANKLIINTSIAGIGNCIKGQIIKETLQELSNKVETSHVLTTADLIEQNSNFTISNGNITATSKARPFNSLLIKANQFTFMYPRIGTGEPLYIGVAIGGHFVGNQTRTAVLNIREIYDQTNNEFTNAVINVSTGDEVYSSDPIMYTAEINQNVFTLKKQNTIIFQFTVSDAYTVDGIAILNYNFNQVASACTVINNSVTDATDKLFSKIGKAEIIGNNKNHRMVAGVIRNTGNGWEFIIDANHQGDMNCVSVNISNDNRLYVDYSGINVKKVISFIAAPDEAFANQGYIIGSSVGINAAYIQIFQYGLNSVSAQIAFTNGTNGIEINVNNSDGVTSAVWNDTSKTVYITHTSVSSKVAQTMPIVSFVPALYGKYMMRLFSYSGTSTKVEFINPTTGQKVTTPDTNMSFSFGRIGSILEKKEINPATLISENGNIWFIGIFEV